MRFQPGNPGGPGRPRGRIAKFRALLGELTGDGREIAEALRAIVRDPASTKKEVIDASALLLSYLLGKPEVAVELNADVTAGPRLDVPRVLARLPSDVIDAVVRELDADPSLQLTDGDEPDDGSHG